MQIEYRHLDLFSGIGGFGLAAQRSGLDIKQHYTSEVEPYCRKLLRERFPDSVDLGDIRNIDPAELPQDRPWIVTGGFPCQDISSANPKAVGIKGKKSGLWSEMFRLIAGLSPRWVLIENVALLTSRGLDKVLYDLADGGYDAEWQVVQAFKVGRPQNRRRAWIVAHPPGDGRRYMSKSSAGRHPETHLFHDDEINRPSDWTSSVREWQEEAVRSHGYKVYPPPVVSRGDAGLSRRVDRIRGLGNAIVPDIAERILTRFADLDRGTID